MAGYPGPCLLPRRPDSDHCPLPSAHSRRRHDSSVANHLSWCLLIWILKLNYHCSISITISVTISSVPIKQRSGQDSLGRGCAGSAASTAAPPYVAGPACYAAVPSVAFAAYAIRTRSCLEACTPLVPWPRAVPAGQHWQQPRFGSVAYDWHSTMALLPLCAIDG